MTRLEKTKDLVSRHKMALRARFALRASVLTLAIALGALVFRDLDLSTDLSYLDTAILSGSPEGQYFKTVQRLAESAAEREGRIENLVSRGSKDSIERLIAARKSCEVQFALAQDGFDWEKYPELRLVGRIGRTEAMLLLGRNGDAIHRITDMRGLRIGVGPEGSGSAFLAERIFSGLDLASLNIALEYHTLKQQTSLAAAGTLDFAMFVMDEDAELIQAAVRDLGLQIVSVDQTAALARRFSFVHYGTLVAGQFDPVRVLPAVDKQLLRLDTLLLGNGCASHSNVIGLMTMVARNYPQFIERNRAAQPPTGLTVSESARGFFENQGAEFADEYAPWLVDIMPPSNWVYTIMAVSLFFNLAGFVNNHRLALIDLNRVALENDIALLFGRPVSNDEIRNFDSARTGRELDAAKLDTLIDVYRRHLKKCRRQSLSVLSPLGEEMGYRDQEIIMTATLDALRELQSRLAAVEKTA